MMAVTLGFKKRFLPMVGMIATSEEMREVEGIAGFACYALHFPSYYLKTGCPSEAKRGIPLI